jgi:hypothetical protein
VVPYYNRMRAAERMHSRLLLPQRNPNREGHIMATRKSTTKQIPLPVETSRRFARIPEWSGYAASDDGHIWSSKSGRWTRLSDTPDRAGRPRATLYDQGLIHRVIVCRLILLAFVGSCSSGQECRHLDGDPANNNIENLQWGTRSENHHDAIRHGTHTCLSGERHPARRVTASMASDMVRLAKIMPRKMIASHLGVSYATVCRYLRRSLHTQAAFNE